MKRLGCKHCPFTTHSFVPGVGNKKARIMLIGESPGVAEVKKGKPFVGPAGKGELEDCGRSNW
jgi:DNA polymerase